MVNSSNHGKANSLIGRAKVRRRLIALTLTLAVVLMGGMARSYGDSAPVNPADAKTPRTASVDVLPTAQIDGVVWFQTIISSTVYVVGKFTKARPAGSAAGQNTVTRNNILAYDLVTGALKSGFAASLNAQAYALAASPDGKRLYVGGEFTTVNGVTRHRIAALNPSTGALITAFKPDPNATVRAIAATGSTVYFGGLFTTVNGNSRSELAAVRATDGVPLPWAPKAAGGRVNAMVLSPASDRLVIGGAFTTLNGSGRPGYGLGAVSTSSGANVTMTVNNTVRNAGKDSAILSLSSDGTNFYGSGYIFGTGGNLEGSFSARWSNTTIQWVEDCHGDTYGVYPSSTAVYVAGHPHYCGNLGGYPNMTSPPAQRAISFSRADTGTLVKDPNGYPSFTGVRAPSLLNWFPQMDTGTVSGQGQAAWAVTGSGSYVVYGGEFLHVNGTAQQGLVRFAMPETAPNRRGPQATGSKFTATLSSPSAGRVKVDWTANYDYDNSQLTYTIYRDGGSQPITTINRQSTWWQRPAMTFTDTAVAAGRHTYQLRVRDPFANTVSSASAVITL